MDDIQKAIERLTRFDRHSLFRWLRSNWELSDDFVSEALPAAYGAPPEARYMSVEEYLAFEETSTLRHEYVAGQVFAMSGVTVGHNRIMDNVVAAFNGHFGNGPCHASSAGIKVHVRIGQDECYYYPDVTVICYPTTGEEKFVSPKLMVEVLSPSTENIDRREKAQNYRHVDSLEEYVIVAQKEREVTISRRSENWNSTIVKAPNAVAEFRSIGLALPLERIYAGVQMSSVLAVSAA